MTSQSPAAERRLIAVHAHPDDESSSNGSTFPKYADEGTHITLVTCTLGEEGEIVVPELAQLGADQADQLGGYRMWELAEACRELDVAEQHFLGGPGRYRDSGMMGEPSNDHPRAFWQADLDEAAAYLVPIIRANRPQVLLTYNENGGYGHPDHIQAHRVAMRAVELAADADYQPAVGDPWEVAKVYYMAFPRSMIARGIEMLKEMGQPDLFGITDAKDATFATDDELVTTEIDGSAYAEQAKRALAAHRTQIDPNHPMFTFMDNIGPEARHDFYQLARGDRGPVDPESGKETDLFAGIDLRA
ncbi:N-acetyl-1-D-myo-inositol-2-amino-2-deoxy-alpha-D-glucopyranoside deacetylase [Epidermidibacterium keratini]|uniref:1D-myo-inositol 2-acetamido-2-deoxy-alpha-D-glucopyranoside deacetylase n=1 Tax=Epidermidibacterium keratini TaxID=1891644 RepID=A0A7L4YK74_9ACTN|nr:N-acetyl-1-D-myo-inositol-2-amino-2-deoxy-alpha-D-glucopyranoside deacetylase [Epidermidibacterium keratini]QHB99654.1 N-acetyl-1-D-myo-inositol-2-amino-2-deoxy-alpha-D-glucopyranoside deacetylase [Epidermidibacterium keratini]